MKYLWNLIKKDTVLFAALCLAVLSMFWVKPSIEYINYIDFRVLGILLSLMLVMAGFQKNGLFDMVGSWLLNRCKNITQLSLVLTFLCFFSSMLITNDVALITFVPFAILTLTRSNRTDLLIPVIVSQTLAANLGSMLTPLGNPQNLYIYNLTGYGFGQFVRVMLPYCVVSGVLLLGMQFFITRSNKESGQLTDSTPSVEGLRRHLWKNWIYGALFVLCLAVVFRILPYYIVLVLIILAILVIDTRILFVVDYSLLFTFIFFFIFTGNLGKLEIVKNFLGQLVAGREIGIGVVASQFISNVPATLLLAGFTTDYEALLIGVNLGGLGTLIASMASLISYKLYACTNQAQKGKYFNYFTISNILFLIVLAGITFVV